MANGAANCPECGSLMRIKETNYGGGITYRIAECECGERWELEERKARKLPNRTAPPAPVYSRVQPYTGADSRPPPPTAVNPPVSAVGGGGGLSSGSQTTADSDPNPQASLLSDPRGRARRKPPATYPPAFELVWDCTGKRGGKFGAFKAWEMVGSPSVDVVRPVWLSYIASLEEWRSPKDVSGWFNGGYHTQTWEPRKPASPKNGTSKQAVPFAVAAEESRSDRHLDSLAEALFDE